MSSHSSTFFKASNYLSTVIARLYPSANHSPGRPRKRIIYATGHRDHVRGRGGCFDGRGCGKGLGGRGGKGRGGKVQGVRGGGIGTYENGIYISDVTRYFGDSEWDKLSNNKRKGITEDPVSTKLLANKKCA